MVDINSLMLLMYFAKTNSRGMYYFTKPVVI
jgi:hypothetical protein